MYTSLSELSPISDNPLLCVRLRRAWRSFVPDSIELLLVDVQEVTIQASINKDLIPKYEEFIVEGNIYELRGFYVIEKPRDNDLTESAYIIMFLDQTFIAIRDFSCFKDSYFIFKPFKDILCCSSFCEGPLFDVIGVVVDFDERLDSDGCMRFIIQDLENNRLLCRISNPLLLKLKNLQRLCKRSQSTCFVIILQLCKKVIYKDEVYVTGQLPVTDVIFNPLLDEIRDFSSRFNNEGGRLCFDGAKFLTPLLKIGKRELGGPGTEVYSINKLSYFEEVLNVWTIGTVTNIRSDMGWFYVSCPRCNRQSCGVNFNRRCRKCDIDLSSYAKFQIFLDVDDDNGAKGCFLIRSEVATFLIESKAPSLISIHFDTFPVLDIQDSVRHLIGREILFKVSLSDQINFASGLGVYDVQNICVCPILLQHYKENMINNLEPFGSHITDGSYSNSEYSDSDFCQSMETDLSYNPDDDSSGSD